MLEKDNNSPQTPESGKKLGRKGVVISYTADKKSLSLTSARRVQSAVSAAEKILSSKGYSALLLRSNYSVPIDLIAWDETEILYIAVRRVRRPVEIPEILEQFGSEIKLLRIICLPRYGQTQIWIKNQNLISRFEVCPGGLIKQEDLICQEERL